MADDLFGKYFLPKKEAAKPTPKVQPKPAYIKTAEMLGVSNADQKAKQVKAQSEQAAIAKRKYDASARTVAIKTAYGTFDVDHKGGLTSQKYAEYQAKLENWAANEGMPKKGVRADVSEPAPVPSELDFARDIVNKSELTKDILDAFPARSLMKTVDPEGKFSQGVSDLGKKAQVPNEQFINEGPLTLAEFMVRQAVNVPGQIFESYGNFINPKTDNVGVIQSGTEFAVNVLPFLKPGSVGYAAWKKSLEMGATKSEAIAAGLKAATIENIGIDLTGSNNKKLADRVVTKGERKMDALSVPAGIQSKMPNVNAPTSQADNFSDAIGAPRAAGQGADDVSGIVPGFRQPIAKMPENRIESLSPQGRAIETWAGANLQKLIDNGVGEDLRTWDAVGKHYGSGAVPRNPEEFKYWVNDLVRTVDESDRNLSLSTEFATKDYAREMQDLRKLVSRSTPIPVNADPSKTVVGLQRQGKGWRVVPNPQLIPLSNVPEPFRLSVLENMRDGETRYTTRENYQAWKDQGKPDSGVLRTRTASELATRDMGGDQSLSDFVTNIGRDGGSDILVPRDAVQRFVRNHFNQQTRAGQAAAAMRKPVKPEDFDAAVKYYNGEAVTAPMDVATPKPVEMKAPVQPKPTPSPQPDIPTTRPAQASEDVPVTSARKAMVADDRANMGLGELDDAVRKSFGESLDNARTKGYDGAWATREAEAVTAKPRALNDEETAGMVDVMTRLKKQHKSVLEQIANETDPAKLDRLRDDLAGIEKQFDGISEAVKLSGTEKGRALASQKITLNEDFDLISVKSQAKAKKGEDLTAKETAKYEDLVNRLTEVDAKIADIELKNIDLQNALDSMPKGAKPGRRIARTDVEIKAARTDALSKWSKSVTSSPMGAGIDPTAYDYKALGQYIATFAEEGVGKVEDVIRAAIASAKASGIEISQADAKKGLLEWGTPKKSTRELDAAIFQRDRLRKEIRNSISDMDSTWVQKVVREASALPRALQATGDLSATLRQGLLLGAGNKRKAATAFGRAMRAVVDPVYSAKLERELLGSPMAVKRKQAGLFIADGETMSLAEEAFMSKVAKEFPILKTISGASERHYTTFLNQLRASVFDDMVKRFPKMDIDEKKALADFINVATGRGRVSPGIAETASKVFFSPRFMASRIEAPLDAVGLTKQGRAMWKSPAARFQLMKSWSTVISSGAGLLSLAKMAGAEVSLDPDSPDFGKARFGDTSFDIWGGMQSPVRLAAKLAKQIKSGEKPEYKKGTAEEAMKFLRYKLAPLPNIIIGAIDKQDAVGQPYLVDKEGKMTAKTVAQDAVKTLSPLLIKDLASLWNLEGDTNTPLEAKIAGSVAAPLGVGVSTYKRKS